MKKINKNKKAQSFNILITIPRMIFLLIMVLVVIFLVSLFIISKIDTHKTEGHTILARILYQPDGLIYYDSDLNRYYPGTIDMNKFNEVRLNKSFSMSSSNIYAFKLTLREISGKEIASIKYKPEWFDNFKALYKPLVEGKGAVYRFDSANAVMLYENNVPRTAILITELYIAKR